MIQVYFEDYGGDRLGAALFGAMPRPGDTISLRLIAGILGRDGSPLPFTDARFKVESVHTHWVAFNHDLIFEWMTPHRTDKEAYAIITVSADNEDTQRYIESVRAKNDEEQPWPPRTL